TVRRYIADRGRRGRLLGCAPGCQDARSRESRRTCFASHKLAYPPMATGEIGHALYGVGMHPHASLVAGSNSAIPDSSLATGTLERVLHHARRLHRAARSASISAAM